MRVVVTGLVATIFVGALAVGVIAGSRSPKTKPLQIVKAGRLDEFRHQYRLDGFMICADASHACPGPYDPDLFW